MTMTKYPLDGLLRHNPFVEAWIDDYQKQDKWHKHPDCPRCGFPHSEVILCGSGATFGCLYIGGEYYSVDQSNVASFIAFREKQRMGFHWRDDIYFQRLADGSVIVTSFWRYNNSPQERTWKIDRGSWESIVRSVNLEEPR